MKQLMLLLLQEEYVVRSVSAQVSLPAQSRAGMGATVGLDHQKAGRRGALYLGIAVVAGLACWLVAGFAFVESILP